MPHLYQQCGMTNPGYSGNTVACIFPQEHSIVGNPFGGLLSRAKIRAKPTQHKRKSHRKGAVTNLSGGVGKTAIFTPRCTVGILVGVARSMDRGNSEGCTEQ